MTDDERATVIEEALVAAAEIEDIGSRVWAISESITHLDDTAGQQLIAECLDLARDTDPTHQPEAFAYAGTHAGPELIERVCTFARAVVDGSVRGGLLGYLAANCDDRVPEPVLTTILELLDPRDQAQPLTALARRVTPELAGKVLEEAARLPSVFLRSDVLEALAPRLPSALLSKALDAVRSISDDYGRALLLARLAEHLPQRRAAMLAEAVIAAQHITYGRSRARVFAKLAEQTPEPQRTELQFEALARAVGAPSRAGRGHRACPRDRRPAPRDQRRAAHHPAGA